MDSTRIALKQVFASFGSLSDAEWNKLRFCQQHGPIALLDGSELSEPMSDTPMWNETGQDIARVSVLSPQQKIIPGHVCDICEQQKNESHFYICDTCACLTVCIGCRTKLFDAHDSSHDFLKVDVKGIFECVNNNVIETNVDSLTSIHTKQIGTLKRSRNSTDQNISKRVKRNELSLYDF